MGRHGPVSSTFKRLMMLLVFPRSPMDGRRLSAEIWTSFAVAVNRLVLGFF